MSAIKEIFSGALEEVLRCGDGPRNYRNGSTKRKFKTQLGEVEVSVPRGRNGEYELQIIGKCQRNVEGIEEKILSFYAHGMTTRDIHAQVKDLYDIDISSELISKTSAKIMPKVNEWQSRPLEAYDRFVFMDAIHYKIRDNHQVVPKAAYNVLGIIMKDIKKYWVSGLAEMKAVNAG